MKLSEKIKAVTDGAIVSDAEQTKWVRQAETLEAASAFLDALYTAGVDNWDGYEAAQEIINE